MSQPEASWIDISSCHVRRVGKGTYEISCDEDAHFCLPSDDSSVLIRYGVDRTQTTSYHCETKWEIEQTERLLPRNLNKARVWRDGRYDVLKEKRPEHNQVFEVDGLIRMIFSMTCNELRYVVRSNNPSEPGCTVVVLLRRTEFATLQRFKYEHSGARDLGSSFLRKELELELVVTPTGILGKVHPSPSALKVATLIIFRFILGQRLEPLSSDMSLEQIEDMFLTGAGLVFLSHGPESAESRSIRKIIREINLKSEAELRINHLEWAAAAVDQEGSLPMEERLRHLRHSFLKNDVSTWDKRILEDQQGA